MDHPGKNAASLLRAFAQRRADLPPQTQLVLCGKPGTGFADLCDIAEALGLGPSSPVARWLGYVPDNLLPALYASAEVFGFPSLYEGFGLPVLEAMASGVPVITSAEGALREVAGDAAALVNPKDVDALGLELVRLFDSPELRRHLAQAGVKRAAGFRWETAAERILDTLLEVSHHAKP